MMWCARHIRSFWRNEIGAIAVPLAIMFPVLIGMVSLAVEYGSWRTKQTQLQNTADTAVYSAAIDLIQGSGWDKVARTIETISAITPFDTGNPTLRYAAPPTEGAFMGQDGYLEVIIEQEVPRLLSKIFTSDPVVIKVRAVASYGGSLTTACMLALSNDASSAIEIGGNADARFAGCSLVSNSTSARAFVMNGGSVQVEAGCIDVVGGVEYTSNLTLTACDAPRTLQPRTMDPYQNLDVPNVSLISNCVSGGVFQGGDFTADGGEISGTPYKCFASSVSLKGTVTFAPGLYIIKDGGLTINASTTLTGSGVTFLLANSADLTVNGGAQLNLTAPTSGDFAGILFLGERSGPVNTHSFSGNAASQLDGIFYFPKDEFDFTGSSNETSNCVQFLSAKISISGNANLTVNCPPSSGKVIYTNITIALRE